MLTLEDLKSFGADTQDGLTRCMNNEALYLKLVQLSVSDGKIAALRKAIEDGDLERAFELAHALKGVFANLALSPLQHPVAEMTERLRAKEKADYMPYVTAIEKQSEKLAMYL